MISRNVVVFVNDLASSCCNAFLKPVTQHYAVLTVQARSEFRMFPRMMATSAGATHTTKSRSYQDTFPAHLSYDVNTVKEMATLLLMVRSAVDDDYRDADFWRDCSCSVQRFFRVAPFSEIAGVIEDIARFQHRDEELMYKFADLVTEELHSLDADALASSLKSHAMLGFKNPQLIEQMEIKLFELMQQSRVTAPGLASSIESLALLYEEGIILAPGTDFLEAVARMVSDHLPFFSVSQLCEVLKAYAVYRIQGNEQIEALFVGIGGVLAREIDQVSAAQCACAAKAFAKCRVHDERLLSNIGIHMRDREVRQALTAVELTELLYGLAKFTCQDTALVDLLSIEGRRRLHMMDVPLMTTTLAAIAKTGVSSPVLAGRAKTQLRKMEEDVLDAVPLQELITLSMAFGKLQTRDAQLFTTFSEAFLRRSGPLFMKEDISNVVNIVHAFTKVHFVHAALFREIDRALYARFEELPVRELVKFLHAIAKVDLVISDPLKTEILNALQAQNISKLGVFEILKVATASRRLGLEVSELEEHVKIVLPHEQRQDSNFMAGIRPPPRKHRRRSARSRKWSW